MTSCGAQIALMNPGGIRADLVLARPAATRRHCDVTYGEVFGVQPFNDPVATST